MTRIHPYFQQLAPGPPSPSRRLLGRRAGFRLWAAILTLLSGAASFAQDSTVASPTQAEGPAALTESPKQAGADAAGDYTEEIVVTARRREENLQQIPVSATAFTQSTLDERSATRLPDLAGSTPNLVLTSGSFGADASDAVVFIRGVGQGDTAIYSDPGVGIYLDGVYLARAQGALLDLVNLDRVEILRGPQGTLFGRNTTGGAIQLITRRPSRQFEKRLSLTGGARHQLDGNLAVEGPLGQDLFGALALYSANSDGFTRSLATGQEFDDKSRDLVRASLEYAPEQGLEAYLTADYLQEDGRGGNQSLRALSRTPLLLFYNQVLSEQGFTPYDGAFVVNDPRTSFAATSKGVDPYLEGRVYGLTLDLGYRSGALWWRSLTGYRQVDYDAYTDADASPVPVSEGKFVERQSQLSEELQLQGSGESLDWLIGAIYFEERPQEDNREVTLGNLFEALELAPGPKYLIPGTPIPVGGRGNPFNLLFFQGDGLVRNLRLTSKSWAIFSESTRRITDRLSLTLGARYTEDRKKFTYLSHNGFGAVAADLANQGSWSDWSGRLSLAWQARPELLIYGNLARGFKSGGFNGRPQSRGVLDPFDPEYVISFELGLKADLLDRRLRLNAAAFTSNYDDIHFGASLQGAGGQPVFITQNAGDAEIRGFEVEAELHPGSAWMLSGTAAYLDTELVRVDPRVPPGIGRGNRLSNSPEWAASAGLQRSTVVGQNAALIARADWTWSGRYFNDLANAASIAQESFGLLGARCTYGPYSGRWEISLFGTNLTDENYLRSGFVATAFGPSLVIAGRPREWGLTTTWRF